MKKQAYQDELTGVKNVTAYDMKVRGLNRRIVQGKAAFAVVMVDLNQLKEVNDRFGHESMAVYDKTCDVTYQAVFNRADARMYEKKQHLAPRT